MTGAGGQIGSWLVPRLRDHYGDAQVIATDIRQLGSDMTETGLFQVSDATDDEAVGQIAGRHKVDLIYHLAAVLSAVGEDDPRHAWRTNMLSLEAVLEVAREQGCAVFTPSSIAVFGPGTPEDLAPQDTVTQPTTMYGITKLSGELLCNYYHKKFGVDTRGVRYPGIVSFGTSPGGGTTDWAVDIFYGAVQAGHYTCFLGPETKLDMMYMPDAVNAAIGVMEASQEGLEHRNAFNVTAMQLTPELLAAQIQKHLPSFTMNYDVDPLRQAIANSWPDCIDDKAARKEWGWEPSFDVESMTKDMLEHLMRV